MKCRMAISLVGYAVLLAAAQGQVPHVDFEIVESVPVETDLGHPDVRDTLEVWLAMIKGAEKTIDVEQFYVSSRKSEPLEEVIQAILAAADRGIRVRFIADSKFYETYPETLDRMDRHDKVEVRIIDFQDLTNGGVQHAKYFIVDGHEVFLGSPNFDWRALKHIREIGVRFRHAGAGACFTDLFELDWRLSSSKEAKVMDQSYPVPYRLKDKDAAPVEFTPLWAPFSLVPSKALWNLGAIIDLIGAAREVIRIQLLSYSPVHEKDKSWPELDQALRSAAARGVKVRLLVSDWCKPRPTIDHLKSLSRVPDVEVKLITIPEHSEGFIPYARVSHAKYMTVDGERAWIGSSNWQRDYFYRSRNVGLKVKNREVTVVLDAVFQGDWESRYAETIDPAKDYVPTRVGE